MLLESLRLKSDVSAFIASVPRFEELPLLALGARLRNNTLANSSPRDISHAHTLRANVSAALAFTHSLSLRKVCHLEGIKLPRSGGVAIAWLFPLAFCSFFAGQSCSHKQHPTTPMPAIAYLGCESRTSQETSI